MKNLTLNELMEVANSIDDDLFGPRHKKFLLKRLIDEAKELLEAAEEAELNPTPENKLAELKEFGDILYCIVACKRQYGWDMEHALALTVTKLQERKKFNVYNTKSIDLATGTVVDTEYEGEDDGQGQEE